MLFMKKPMPDQQVRHLQSNFLALAEPQNDNKQAAANPTSEPSLIMCLLPEPSDGGRNSNECAEKPSCAGSKWQSNELTQLHLYQSQPGQPR